jgi:hypothetical protein
MGEDQKSMDSHQGPPGDDEPKTVDEAAARIVGWIKEGVMSSKHYSEGFMFDEEYARDLFRFRYGHSIEKRLLKDKAWGADRGTLQLVADLHGSIAVAIAILKKSPKILDADFWEAANLVQSWCHLGLAAKGLRATLGQWCEPWP